MDWEGEPTAAAWVVVLVRVCSAVGGTLIFDLLAPVVLLGAEIVPTARRAVAVGQGAGGSVDQRSRAVKKHAQPTRGVEPKAGR
jgi:hypothetical protein